MKIDDYALICCVNNIYYMLAILRTNHPAFKWVYSEDGEGGEGGRKTLMNISTKDVQETAQSSSQTIP